ncbi:MAG: hypothetical protein AUJ52_10710 [Elusimicrobia bacterium CG1_02_63_36]|nr:MAG: hypothetical protein AUJ52_10710 [Elusimicrobia bacterium CG1_02_63_36]PIP84411.1 MAG: hypothetical protein COR54_04400 [Elusimicrobia bacterium CG22_combo_CG10-13_8_21_14_all_63_91]PJA18664.1 MAG: hypothetical protein COX66_00670 [Elusimicrobia bacterium CG_4_10_14_0_2_um_filter_63_34]PJB23408.1 MAG: hypothetical protein CO113_18385 [Elusimicrobia bacterium CG_4_9_14_3_um_filter_62_55]
MNRPYTLLVAAALIGFAATADAGVVIGIRTPGILPVSPMIGNPGINLPTSRIPSINVPNIVPTIGELPLPVLPLPTLPFQSALAPAAAAPVSRLAEAAPAPSASRTFNDGFATVHAVAVPLVDADARIGSRRDTVENRLRTRRLVEFVRDTLELDDETTLEDLESAFDGRADEAEKDRPGTVVLPERELEEELGLR